MNKAETINLYVEVKKDGFRYYIRCDILDRISVSTLLEHTDIRLLMIADFVFDVSNYEIIKDRSGQGITPCCKKVIDLTTMQGRWI